MGWLYIFLSCLCFGITNCIWSVALKEADYFTTIINRTFFTVLLFAVPVLLVSNPTTIPILYTDIIQAIVISAVSCLGLICYVYSLRFTKVSLAVPISSLNALFGILTAILVLNESFHYSVLAALLLIVLALRLLQEKNTFALSTGVWLNIGAAFFWGVTFALFRIPINKLGPWLFGFILEACVLITTFLLFLWQRRKWTWTALSTHWRLYLLLGLLGFGGGLFFNLSTLYLPITLLSILGVSTIFLSLLISKLWLKEKLPKQEWISIALFLIAVVILKAFY